MLIWACTIIRIQPFDQQFFCPLKSRCFQSKKLKIKLMKSQKNEANFVNSQWFCSFPYSNPCILLLPSQAYFLSLLFVVYHFLLFHTIPLSFTIIDFLRFFHSILLFHPILSLIFVDLSILYHYFDLYYYLGLQSTVVTEHLIIVRYK